MTIVDGRTSLDTWESNQPDDLTGAAGGTADTEIFIEGSQSYGYYTTSTRAGLLFDAGSAQNWSNNTFYMWVNCGIAGLLATLANGGLAARFCGATVTNWFEVNLAGSDSYPAAVQGGWVMFVVDIEKAKTASNRTNGTPPATNAIRYVGISTITAGAMPRMVDNTWLDAMWRLPANTAGIRVEGQNSSVDWTFADIVSTAEAGTWGTAKLGPGGSVVVNTPIQFGANDGVTHGFSDTNQVVLWEDWDVDPNLYGFTIIGGSGAQSFQLGLKSGTGDDATGSQGIVVTAEASGERWFFDCDDSNIDVCNIYGCTFIHGGGFQLDDAQVSVISSFFIDCVSAAVANVSDFLRNSVINPATVVATAFVTTDDLADIVFCTFEAGTTGHAIELTTPVDTTQESKGNVFSGYGPEVGQFDTENDVNGSTEVITVTAHSWSTEDPVVYDKEGGTEAIGLTEGNVYYVRSLSVDTISLHPTASDAAADTNREDLTASGAGNGETHSLYSGDAAVFNNQAATVTINVSDSGSTPSIRNGVSADTTVNNPVTLTVSGIESGSEVRLFLSADRTELDGIESSGTSFVYNYNYTVDTAIYIIVQKVGFKWRRIDATLLNQNQTIPANQSPDANYLNP